MTGAHRPPGPPAPTNMPPPTEMPATTPEVLHDAGRTGRALTVVVLFAAMALAVLLLPPRPAALLVLLAGAGVLGFVWKGPPGPSEAADTTSLPGRQSAGADPDERHRREKADLERTAAFERGRAERSRKQLEQAEKERRQLLADITHELATPLTSIRGYAETLQNPDVSTTADEHQEFLGHILDEARRMELLIEDLFEMSRLESGAVKLREERLDWGALCRHTVERFGPKFERAGLSLVDAGLGDASKGGAAWVEADGRRLEQVLENLLVNAVRYVPEGGTCWASLGPAELGGKPAYRLEVRDDGPGFPPGDLTHVFDRFYRGEVTESFPGSGLGLAIVKEIVERQRGRVEAANREPSGAVLAILLPALD